MDDAISVLPGGRFSAPGATLRGLITTAYGLLDLQVVDSRRLLGSDRYQIEGRTNPEVSLAEARAMLRTLLAGRFGLVTHRETRELPVYVMTVDRKPVSQLRPSGPERAMFKVSGWWLVVGGSGRGRRLPHIVLDAAHAVSELLAKEMDDRGGAAMSTQRTTFVKKRRCGVYLNTRSSRVSGS